MPGWLTPLSDSSLLLMVSHAVLIWLAAVLALWAVRLSARQIERRLEQTVKEAERLRRLKTLVRAGHSLTRIFILVLALLMTLQTAGVDIGPVLAGAGLAGLALSLGAQSLIKDFIGGVLILTEGQFVVGDVIRVGEVEGTVERITLRATYLRQQPDGRKHVIPNGEIRILSNLTRDWARAVVDLNVAFEADFGKVKRALESAAQQAQADEGLKADLLDAPEAVGWIGFKDWGVQVRLMARTVPGKQWAVANVLRHYALEALQAEGVRVARPAQDVRVKND